MTQIVSCYLIFMMVCIQKKPRYKLGIINRALPLLLDTNYKREARGGSVGGGSAAVAAEAHVLFKILPYRLLSRFGFVLGRH